MSVLEELHAKHKERLARINNAAYRPPVPAREPEPQPAPDIDQWMNRQKGIWFWIEGEVDAPEPRRPTIAEIQRATAKYFNMTLLDMLSQRRTHNIIRPRQIAMYLCKMLTLKSLPEIGRKFEGRDHTTVLSNVRKITGLVETDANIRAAVNEIKAKLGMD